MHCLGISSIVLIAGLISNNENVKINIVKKLSFNNVIFQNGPGQQVYYVFTVPSSDSHCSDIDTLQRIISLSFLRYSA